MAQQIRRFSVVQTAKVFGVIQAIMALIQVPTFSAKSFPWSVPVTPLLLPIVFGIVGFITTALGCAIYNVVAGKVGGIEFQLEAGQVRHVSILQTAKVFGVMYGLLGIVFGLVLVLVFRFVSIVPGGAPGAVGSGFVLGAPLMYGVLGFLVAAVGGALYNWAAGMVGGIELQLDTAMTGQRIRRFAIVQTAKVFGVLYGMIGLAFLPLLVALTHVTPKGSGFMAVFAWLFPVVFAVGGFVSAAVGCAVYNGVARVIGGIQLQLEDDPVLT